MSEKENHSFLYTKPPPVPKDENMIVEFPISNFPADLKPEVGMQLNA